MGYERFANISPEFLRIFKIADFGRRGNPLAYNSQGHDLADMLSFLFQNGIPEFTIAAPIGKYNQRIIERLENLAENGMPISVMVTYHHYFDNLETI